jgi:hypothetical protein
MGVRLLVESHDEVVAFAVTLSLDYPQAFTARYNRDGNPRW